MGLFDKLVKALGMKKIQVNILVVGLNNSGKSTIVSHFKNPDERSTISVPTVGFQIEQFEKNNLFDPDLGIFIADQGVCFTAFDMSGAGRYRNLWEHHFKNCQGIVFVIDSSDRMRLVVVKDELELLLQHPDIEKRRVPILFFANKMDMPDALSSVKIAAGLGLDKIENKPWHISSSNALTGEGLQDGVSWLVQQIKECMAANSNKQVKKEMEKEELY